MSKKIKTKIYGWVDIEDGVLAEILVNINSYKVIDKITGELLPKRVIDLAYHKGRWFTTFEKAKQALIHELMAKEIKYCEIKEYIQNCSVNDLATATAG